MGTVFAEITIKNVADETRVQEGLIGEQEIRSVTVTSVVDTGAWSLVINEELREKLGLRITEERILKVADGRRVNCQITGPVTVQWKDRSCPCAAVVVPGAESILLGLIPLEGMDLMVNPKTQQLEGVHGDQIEYMLY
jgi:clan AA aspartic protease